MKLKRKKNYTSYLHPVSHYKTDEALTKNQVQCNNSPKPEGIEVNEMGRSPGLKAASLSPSQFPSGL
jgi:hypothetical protein